MTELAARGIATYAKLGIMGNVGTPAANTWTGLSDDDDPDYVARAEHDWQPTYETVAPLSVLDIAAWFVACHGRMDTYKLQKLCYYAQAQHVARFHTRLFVDRIEGWENGPVVPTLFAVHRKRRAIDEVPGGDSSSVAAGTASADTLSDTWERYGSFTGKQLSEMTHREQPWLDAREGLGPHEAGHEEIRVETLRDYYAAFTAIEDVDVPPEG